MDTETLDDLRTTVVDNLPDAIYINRKKTGSVDTDGNSDGMGGFSPTASNIDDVPEPEPIEYRGRVTSPRSSMKGAETTMNNVSVTETIAVIVIGIPLGGAIPELTPEDAITVVDGETGKISEYEVQRLIPHSSPFTIHVNCVDLN